MDYKIKQIKGDRYSFTQIVSRFVVSFTNTTRYLITEITNTNWILFNALWNDDKFWIDTEFWKD